MAARFRWPPDVVRRQSWRDLLMLCDSMGGGDDGID